MEGNIFVPAWPHLAWPRSFGAGNNVSFLDNMPVFPGYVSFEVWLRQLRARAQVQAHGPMGPWAHGPSAHGPVGPLSPHVHGPIWAYVGPVEPEGWA